MYVPASFAQTDLATLHDFIVRNSFATLVSFDGDAPEASHIPLLLDPNRGPQGTLVGHFARANTQWKRGAGRSALAIFHGPHAYVSPAWYEEPNAVPTWNYIAVHATGTLQLIDQRDRLLDLVRTMVDHYEAAMPSPWKLDSQDESYVSRMLDGIVGFEIAIERLDGKWKLSQNHSDARRQRVVEHLRTGSPDARQIADLMQSNR